jgi:tetratricopeptide (TPR) repeat protein
MGNVFLAKDPTLGRRVAIKLLHADAEQDPAARERLRREARAAAALNHAYICQIHEIGEADGRLFIVLEYVDGETLHALATRSLLSLPQVVEFASEIVEALEHAHRRGVVHRDLKPSNVMVTVDGHIKVMDFGLAKHRPATVVDPAGSTSLTDPGTRLGTPAYMSPEQVRGAELGPSSDLFSLGVILYELATGRHPFLRADPSDTMAAILRDAPLPGVRDLDALPGLGALILRMLAKASADRPSSMGALSAALETLRTRARASIVMAESPTDGFALTSARTPLVGRDAEATELRRLLDRLVGGIGGMAVLGGEPGVGKTRLAEELLREARQRGCLCVTGHGSELEGAPPFAPFIEATEHAVRLVPQAMRTAMGEQAAELSTMVPSLRRTYADVPPVPEVPREQQRRLVFGAYIDTLRRATQQAPMVMLLDDLHWADEPSLQLLLHVAPQLASMRLLIVSTYRDVELDVQRPFAHTLEQLLRQRLATRVSLRRLPAESVQQMLAALGGSAPPSGLAHAVFQETEGNPFFVEEVYHHLAEEGRLFEVDGSWKADLRVGSIEVPEGVRLVLGRRLERLGERARKLLTAAAVIGRTFPLDLLQTVAEVPEDDVLEALDEAERAHLIATDTESRRVRYRFGHELIRTTLAAGLSLPRRQRLHLRIAEALERPAAPAADVSVLAHHLYQAGAAADTQRTASALEAAGRAALDAGAFEDALELCDQVHRLGLHEDDPLVAETHERRGHALGGLLRLDEAVGAFEQAFAVYKGRHANDGIARSVHGAAEMLGAQLRFTETVAWANRGLQALSGEAPRERASLLSRRAAELVGALQLDQAWESVHDALVIAERLGDDSLLASALTTQGLCHHWSAEFLHAVEALSRARTLLPAKALWQHSTVLTQLALIHIWLGRLTDSEALLAELRACVGRAANHQGLYTHTFWTAAVTLARTGDLQGHRTSIEALLRTPLLPLSTKNAFGVDQLYLGHRHDAIDTFTALASEERAATPMTSEAQLFATAALTGDPDHTHASLPVIHRCLPTRGQRNHLLTWWALESFVAGLAFLQDREACAPLYPLLLDDIRTGHVLNFWSIGPINAQLGAAFAANAAELPDRAREHFEAAAAQARDAPMRLLQPTVLYWHGRFLARQPSPDEQLRGRAMVQAALEDSGRSTWCCMPTSRSGGYAAA